MAIKCANVRCSYRSERGVCRAGYRNLRISTTGKCELANQESPPYKECGTCLSNYRYCNIDAKGNHCEFYMEGEEV